MSEAILPKLLRLCRELAEGALDVVACACAVLVLEVEGSVAVGADCARETAESEVGVDAADVREGARVGLVGPCRVVALGGIDPVIEDKLEVACEDDDTAECDASADEE